MATAPSLGMRPWRKRAKPRAEKMTSVDTSTVEEAMEVHFRDSNQVEKWRARQAPLRAHIKRSRRVAERSSVQWDRSTEGRRSRTVQPSRPVAVTREGAARPADEDGGEGGPKHP